MVRRLVSRGLVASQSFEWVALQCSRAPPGSSRNGAEWTAWRAFLGLIGRLSEQARLDELLEAARAGRSGALVVRGEPGVGKTSLLDYAASRAGGFRVLRTLGAESESELAFSGLLELLRPVTRRAGELPEVQARALEAALGGAGEVDRFAVYAATLGVVALVAEDGPLLCVMDDAQWVDPASSEALAFTARRLADEGVLILFGARDGEATYFEGRGIPELRLVGLGGAGCASTRAGVVSAAARLRGCCAARRGNGRQPVGAGRDPGSSAGAAAAGERAAG